MVAEGEWVVGLFTTESRADVLAVETPEEVSIPSRDQDAATVHGTQKPVECMRRPILNNSAPGQAVYEPFSGSGTTIIAAETTDRACFAMELSPAYVDVAALRWEAFTGAAATLDGDGRSFGDVAAERLG